MCYNSSGDDTYPAEDSLEMYAHVHEEGAGMVTGCRLSSTYFQQNKSPFHNFSNSIKHKERREFEFRLQEINRWRVEEGVGS